MWIWILCLMVLIYHLGTKFGQKCWSTPKLWPKIEIKDGGRPPSSIFENLISDQWVALGCRFSIWVPKMLIDAQIMAKSLNSRWQPSAILDFWKPDLCPMRRLRLFIFHHSAKFGAKMFIDAQITAKYQNSRWQPSAILEFLYHHIGTPTKSLRWDTSASQILC